MTQIMKKIFYSAMIIVSAALTMSCDALNQYPHTETTSKDVYTSVDNYKAVLGKIYTSFVTAGQEKGGGNEDLSSYFGYDYMRCYFNMQELGTDEVIYTWLGGDELSGITYLEWDVNDNWVSDTYYRIYYTIALCNEFLRNATDDAITSFSDTDKETIAHYRAEARFVRAFCYWHVLDLYRQGPFVDENGDVGGETLPEAYDATQLFDYIESELLDCSEDLQETSAILYGRATKEAAWFLLARLYLNAEVYTGEAHWTDCITWCKKVIDAGFSLEEDYTKLFNADNDRRTNEIIFAFPVDADYCVSWGSSTYVVCGSINNASDYQDPADYGATSGWGSFRVRGALPDKFDEGDGRALFFTEGQSKTIDVVENQAYGYLPTKWTNLTDDGEAASNTDANGVDTDFPVFRLADAYLMLAEAVVNGGSGSSADEALGYVNAIRERAFGDASGDITASQLTDDFILEERARELYMEGIRRTDLVRHGKFTSGDYLWEWKGGVYDGKEVDDKYNYYPIPATELTANTNLKNEEY